MPHVSIVGGSFCSYQSKAELGIVTLDGINTVQSNSKLPEKIRLRSNTSMIETLPTDVFAQCVSLTTR